MRTAAYRRVKYPHLATRRSRLGLTDGQIAALAGMKRSKWRGVLNGKCFCSEAELPALCDTLKLPAEAFPHIHRPDPAQWAKEEQAS